MRSNRYDHMPDAELLEKYYSDRNQEWLGILLERYTLLLLGVCMKYLKEEEEAKDCVQQIFLKVLTEASKFKIDYFKSWLYMVAKNHCLMKLRSQQGKSLQSIQEEITQKHVENNQQDFIAHEKTYTFLEESIDELNEEQKKCITLFYLQKKSYQQIAGQTGYSLMQVKSHIQNGKRNLRLLVEKKLKQSKASF